MYIGNRHRFTASIGITGTFVGTLRALGAIGFIVKIFGGSNGADNLSSMQASPSHDGIALTQGGIDTSAVGVAGLTNATEGSALALYIPSNPVTAGLITPWHTEWVQFFATMLVAASNGCTVDVWPVYDERPKYASQLPS